MKRLLSCLLALSAVALFGGCNSDGAPASPPASVQVEARENGALVTFPMVEGVEYWLFYALSSNLTSTNFTSVLGGRVLVGAVSPQFVPQLANGSTYYFTINGRTNGGPGGEGTPLVSTVPRIAGENWRAGAPLAAGDLRGAAFGSVFVAAGANGALFTSLDGLTWTPVNPVVGSHLNAVGFVNGVYVAVGAAGALLASADAATWTQQATGTTSDLQAVAGNGAGTYVVVGADGTILYNLPDRTWTRTNSGTTNRLNGVMYGNGRFVAVGAGGVVLTSTDGITWAAAVSQTSADLHGVAYSGATGQFVALGAAGALVTSPDGVTWTARAPVSANAVNSVVAGSQFVAAGSAGTLLTSTDGINWKAAASGTAANLFAVAYGFGVYVSTGAAGANLSSR